MFESINLGGHLYTTNFLHVWSSNIAPYNNTEHDLAVYNEELLCINHLTNVCHVEAFVVVINDCI